MCWIIWCDWTRAWIADKEWEDSQISTCLKWYTEIEDRPLNLRNNQELILIACRREYLTTHSFQEYYLYEARRALTRITRRSKSLSVICRLLCILRSQFNHYFISKKLSRVTAYVGWNRNTSKILVFTWKKDLYTISVSDFLIIQIRWFNMSLWLLMTMSIMSRHVRSRTCDNILIVTNSTIQIIIIYLQYQSFNNEKQSLNHFTYDFVDSTIKMMSITSSVVVGQCFSMIYDQSTSYSSRECKSTRPLPCHREEILQMIFHKNKRYRYNISTDTIRTRSVSLVKLLCFQEEWRIKN